MSCDDTDVCAAWPLLPQDLVSDVHCIIEAMIGRGSDVTLQRPQVCPSSHLSLEARDSPPASLLL